MSKNNSSTLALETKRFKIYVRDKSTRGRALALAHILDKLQKHKDYKQFAPMLKTLIKRVREQGEGNNRELVIRALKNYFCEIDEIAEETLLASGEVEAICFELVEEGKVRHDFRTSLRLGAGNKIDLFFWNTF